MAAFSKILGLFGPHNELKAWLIGECAYSPSVQIGNSYLQFVLSLLIVCNVLPEAINQKVVPEIRSGGKTLLRWRDILFLLIGGDVIVMR